MLYLTLTEKSKATIKRWFSRLLWHPAMETEWFYSGTHVHMLTYLLAPDPHGTHHTGNKQQSYQAHVDCCWRQCHVGLLLALRRQHIGQSFEQTRDSCRNPCSLHESSYSSPWSKQITSPRNSAVCQQIITNICTMNIVAMSRIKINFQSTLKQQLIMHLTTLYG